MGSPLSLPRLVFGSGKLADLEEELALLGAKRPLLISDRGLERAGIVAMVRAAAPSIAETFLEVPENPTLAGADAAFALYQAAGCDAVIGLGGGSVLDTSKIVAALPGTGASRAAEIAGQPQRIKSMAPLVAIPTTVGTGSESSPASAMHAEPHGALIGTRSHLLIPKVAVCDPDLVRSLPPRLIAATAIDAMSHCLEGFLAVPASPVIDSLALDGIARVFQDVQGAVQPDGDAARASMMVAAFSGGAAIQKGLGPAHAVALACGDQDAHHGTLIGVALPHTTALMERHVPERMALVRKAMGIEAGADIGAILFALIESLGLPTTLAAAGYRCGDRDQLVESMAASPFNRTSPYAPSAAEYRTILERIAE